MANTLTNLIPDIYEAIDVVSRERVGFIPAVTKNSSAERAALNESIRVPIAPAVTSEADNTPAVNAPDTGDNTIDNVVMTISNSKHIPVRWNGEETRGLNVAGTFSSINAARFAQAFRRLGNLIEIDVAKSYKEASRAVGTAGTTPFGTADDFSDFANVAKILDDNGCPQDESWRLVLGNAAMANIRAKQSSLFKANEAGTDELLRDGKVMRVMGFNIGQSGQVQTHTRGTAASATLTSTDYATGSTALTLAAAGTGTFVAGDQVNIAGENNGIWYGVSSGDTDVSDGGTLTLNKPGLTIAQTTNTSAVTVPANAFKANLAFHPSAIQLITRAPAMPEGGDMATDSLMVTDPISGLTFEVLRYEQFRQVVYHVAIAWGYKVIKPEHVAVLFG